MRKLLLGTTAVVGAALLAPEMAAAQQAPTVRIGGFFRAYYGYTQQTSPHVHRRSRTQTPATGGYGRDHLARGRRAAAGTTGAGQRPGSHRSARTGKHDFSTDAEVHVFVNGKTANGLTYGAVVEMQFDGNEGHNRPARRSQTAKTTADIDELYAFIASPTLGQIRFGDEDGPFGGLMNAGFITNFGTGGVYGDWEDFVIRPNRTTTSPGSSATTPRSSTCRRSSSASTSAPPGRSTRARATTRAARAALRRRLLRPRLRRHRRDRRRPRPPEPAGPPQRVPGHGPLARQRRPGRPRGHRRRMSPRR